MKKISVSSIAFLIAIFAFTILSFSNARINSIHKLELLTEIIPSSITFTQAEIDCEDDLDCDDEFFCNLDQEVCTPQKANGLACERDEECLSFDCTNNVCVILEVPTTTGSTSGTTTTTGTNGSTTSSTTGSTGTTGGTLPTSGILDDNPLILYGLFSIVAGLLFYKLFENSELSFIALKSFAVRNIKSLQKNHTFETSLLEKSDKSKKE